MRTFLMIFIPLAAETVEERSQILLFSLQGSRTRGPGRTSLLHSKPRKREKPFYLTPHDSHVALKGPLPLLMIASKCSEGPQPTPHSIDQTSTLRPDIHCPKAPVLRPQNNNLAPAHKLYAAVQCGQNTIGPVLSAFSHPPSKARPVHHSL